MNRYVIRRVRLGSIMLIVLAMVLLIQYFLPQDTVSVSARFPRQTLVIDPGHGGVDGGAVSVSGQKESDINLAIARTLDELMGFYGAPAVMTRQEDVSIHDDDASTIREKKVSDIKNRVALVNGIENATLISIHQNSFTSSQQHGTQVFYGDEVLSLPLARQIQDTVRQELDPENDREPRPIPASVYLLNHVSCRTVLVECGFLSNLEEDRLLQEKAYQMKLAMVVGASYIQCGNTQEGEGLI